MNTESDLDQETEAPPLGIFGPDGVIGQSCPDGPDYDQWGNVRADPVKVIEEAHGENFIKIFIYKAPRDSYFFGFQLKIEKVVRQKRANIADQPHRGPESARMAARDMIIDICKKNHGIKRLFADFTVIRYNQPELF
jgi:hypothetical protein